MANIFQDHMRDGRVNIKGSALVLGYFKEIPEPERLPAQMQFKSLMGKEGFALVAR
jgi:hypothetical protein